MQSVGSDALGALRIARLTGGARDPYSPVSSSNTDLASTFFLDFSLGFTVKSAKISILSSNKLGSKVLSFSLFFGKGLTASVANISS